MREDATMASASALPYAPDSSASARAAGRLRSLDGLRGVAAIIVVIHHLSRFYDPLAVIYQVIPGVSSRSPVGSFAWWLTSTPAQLLVAGPEAVLVFFVLSGLVLTLPVINRANFDWLSYYPQRLARLYLPAIASLVFAAALGWSTISIAAPPSGRVADTWSVDNPSLSTIVGASDLLFGDTSLNTPLWSLRWEVLFSLLLPVFVALVVVAQRRWWAVVIASGTLAIVGAYHAGFASFLYMPLFVIGAVIAVKLGDIREWAEHPSHRRAAHWGGLSLLIGSIVVLTSHATVWGFFPGQLRLQAFAQAISFVGAVGIVLCGAVWPPLVRLLSRRLFQWLGRISFSIYLVHVPIAAAADRVAGAGHTLLVVIVTFALAIVAAVLFERFVERPSHQLAKRIGRAASSAIRRRQDSNDGTPAAQ